MPSVSRKQQQMMAIAAHNPSKLYARNKGVLGMEKAKLREFAGSILGKHKK